MSDRYLKVLILIFLNILVYSNKDYISLTFDDKVKVREVKKYEKDLIDLTFNIYYEKLDYLKKTLQNDENFSLEEKKTLIALLEYNQGNEIIDYQIEKDFFKNKQVRLKNININTIDKIAITREKNGSHYLYLKGEKWIKYNYSKRIFLKDYNNTKFTFIDMIFFKNKFYVFYRKYLNSVQYVNIINKYSYENNDFLLKESIVFLTNEEDEARDIEQNEDFCLMRFVNENQIMNNSLSKYMENLSKEFYEKTGGCLNGS